MLLRSTTSNINSSTINKSEKLKMSTTTLTNVTKKTTPVATTTLTNVTTKTSNLSTRADKYARKCMLAQNEKFSGSEVTIIPMSSTFSYVVINN